MIKRRKKSFVWTKNSHCIERVESGSCTHHAIKSTRFVPNQCDWCEIYIKLIILAAIYSVIAVTKMRYVDNNTKQFLFRRTKHTYLHKQQYTDFFGCSITQLHLLFYIAVAIYAKCASRKSNRWIGNELVFMHKIVSNKITKSNRIYILWVILICVFFFHPSSVCTFAAAAVVFSIDFIVSIFVAHSMKIQQAQEQMK